MNMAHNLAQTRNGQYMTAWAGDTPWHGLGTQAEALMTATEALKLGNLDWTVEKRPLYNRTELGEVEVVENTFGVFRKQINEDGSHSWIALNRGTAVGRVWKPFQNIEAVDFLDELVQTQEAKIEVVGALGRGEKVWVLAKLPDSILINGVDKIDQYILIVNSHDGSGSLKIFLTPVRVVCNNTLTMALQGRKGGYNIRHTGKLHDRLEQAREVLGLVNTDFMEWGEMAQSLVEVKLTEDEMESYFIDSLNLTFNDEGDLTTRSSNMLKTVKGLLGNEKNTLNGMEGTAWAAYNALTEAVDHNFTRLANGKVSTKRMESALFGTYSRTKQKAFVKALELTV
tara:strand:- start:1640 stop:2662 length:1023 start_codon:yes stop_codon:yes gene_type:complete